MTHLIRHEAFLERGVGVLGAFACKHLQGHVTHDVWLIIFFPSLLLYQSMDWKKCTVQHGIACWGLL